MWRSLQGRLAISHLLPLLVIVPLLSLLLVYLLETRYALNDTAAELAVQGELIARLYQAEWPALQESDQPQPLVARLQLLIPARIYLTDINGNVLVSPGLMAASTEAPVNPPDPDLLQKALAGEIARQVRYSLERGRNAVDVAVPVHNENQEVVGAVQLSQQLTQVNNRLTILRWTVWGTVGAGFLVAGLLSFAFSRSLNQPLARLTKATRAVYLARQPSFVKEEGPSEVRTLARTFNEMSERLYELEQGRRRLLSSVVHELGRPLGAIKVAAQVLRQNDKKADLVIELSSGIDEQVDQLRCLLDDLALLAQSDVQDLVLTCVPTDVGALVLEECRRHDPRIQEKNIKLVCHIPAPDISLEVDPVRLGQIVGNLLDNAIKYTPNAGEIRVMVRAEANSVQVLVGDSGPGIDPSEHERIFDFLYRSPHQERVREGMGIGLALSRRLAEAHGGTLTVQNDTDGPGSLFVLSLPNTSDQ